MQIVLFGGAFNPPHLGHLLVIQQAFELIPQMDELWLLPCFKHTFQKQLAPVQHRLNMAKILLTEVPTDLKKRVKLETLEIDQKLSGETYETLQLMKEKYPHHNFSFLMGSDQIGTFNKWGSYQKLLQEMPFYVYPRNGYDEPVNFDNMTLLESPTQVITNLSSNLIRKRITQNLPLINLTPQSITNYLAKNQLYQS